MILSLTCWVVICPSKAEETMVLWAVSIIMPLHTRTHRALSFRLYRGETATHWCLRSSNKFPPFPHNWCQTPISILSDVWAAAGGYSTMCCVCVDTVHNPLDMSCCNAREKGAHKTNRCRQVHEYLFTQMNTDGNIWRVWCITQPYYISIPAW